MAAEDKSIFTENKADGSGGVIQEVTVPDGEIWYIDELRVYATADESSGGFSLFETIIKVESPDGSEITAKSLKTNGNKDNSTRVGWGNGDNGSIGRYITGGFRVVITENLDTDANGMKHAAYVSARRVL